MKRLMKFKFWQVAVGLLLVFGLVVIVSVQDQVHIGESVRIRLTNPAFFEIQGEQVRLEMQSSHPFVLTGPQSVKPNRLKAGIDTIYYIDLRDAQGVWSVKQNWGVTLLMTSDLTSSITLRSDNQRIVNVYLLLLFTAIGASLVVIWLERRDQKRIDKKVVENQEASEVG